MNTPDGQRYFTTDRPVAVLMVFVALVVFGYFSLGQLREGSGDSHAGYELSHPDRAHRVSWCRSRGS